VVKHSARTSAWRLESIPRSGKIVKKRLWKNQCVDFSNIYFVAEDAVLAKASVQVTVNSPQDLAGERVGLQDASVYQQGAQTNLVDTGLTAHSQLIVYLDADVFRACFRFNKGGTGSQFWSSTNR
jgi:hypothetical protein